MYYPTLWDKAGSALPLAFAPSMDRRDEIKDAFTLLKSAGAQLSPTPEDIDKVIARLNDYKRRMFGDK